MQTTLITNANEKSRTGLGFRVLNVVLWVFQVLLAVVFLLHGWLLVAPPADMVEMMDAQLGVAFRLFLGVAELLAAIGLILPGITRILPQLIPVTAVGLMIVMVSATILHVARGETSSAAITAILFVIITAVAYLRWKVVPITARKRTNPSA